MLHHAGFLSYILTLWHILIVIVYFYEQFCVSKIFLKNHFIYCNISICKYTCHERDHYKLYGKAVSPE